ncbi:MAG: YggT family protein [Steroidobacteraceae bacterium]|jgi:YggT family protein|nr:YggT family protein [Steroidobacteraceae bacterium]
MEAIIFIVRTLLQVLLVVVFLLRVLLPLVRADARNQLSQAVIRLTNPLVLPLRRVLPPVRKVDTASVAALFIVQIAATATLWLLGAYRWATTAPQFLQISFISLVLTILQFYSFAVFLYALLSLIAPGAYSPAISLLQSLCEPVLRPIRRIIPPLGGFDLSALFALIGLQALHIAIRPLIY